MDKLSDLEIEIKIADIEGIQYYETKHETPFLAILSENDFTGTPPEMVGKYNPLTDDALCFQLMVKYDLDFSSPYRPHGDTEYDVESFIDGVSDAIRVSDENPNKAICLAIIEAHKE